MIGPRALLAFALLGVLLFAGAARAQRAGVPVAALLPPGGRLTAATAPLAPGLPARLVFDGTLLVDVVVAPDRLGAERALARMLRGYAREPGPRSAAFAVDNVAILIRCLGDRCDVAAQAARARRAIEHASRGAPRGLPLRAREGELVLPSTVLAARVIAHGPALVRRLQDRRFLVERTGPGRLEIEVVGVDDRLRPIGSPDE